MWLVFRYALAGLRAAARERRELALENIALRHQIEVLTRTRRRRPLRPGDRLLWSSLSRVWPVWRRHVVIVQPDTVVRWHRTAWPAVLDVEEPGGEARPSSHRAGIGRADSTDDAGESALGPHARARRAP